MNVNVLRTFSFAQGKNHGDSHLLEALLVMFPRNFDSTTREPMEIFLFRLLLLLRVFQIISKAVA